MSLHTDSKSHLLNNFRHGKRHMSRLMAKPSRLHAERRLGSACASVQSHQSLCCALSGQLRTQAFFMRTVNSLTRLGRCPGWSVFAVCTIILLVLSWGGSSLFSDVAQEICHFYTQWVLVLLKGQRNKRKTQSLLFGIVIPPSKSYPTMKLQFLSPLPSLWGMYLLFSFFGIV